MLRIPLNREPLARSEEEIHHDALGCLASVYRARHQGLSVDTGVSRPGRIKLSSTARTWADIRWYAAFGSWASRPDAIALLKKTEV